MTFLTVAALLVQHAEPEIVRNEQGELAEGYSIGQGCHAPSQCGEFVRDDATGSVIMYRGQWATGYVETGRGREVIKLPPNDTQG